MKANLSTALVVICAAFALAGQNDWLIVPGKRLGPITSTTARTDLDRLFGKSNVVDQEVDGGEGPLPATVVFPKEPSAALAIFWEANRIVYVFLCFQQEVGPCKWHTADGVSLGTSLQRLEFLNGRPFEMVAWGSDVGGNVFSWRGGRLAVKFGDRATTLLGFNMSWPNASEGPTPGQLKLLNGVDGKKEELLSSDSALRQLHTAVDHITFTFPAPVSRQGR